MAVPGCRCRPTNTLLWELSDADLSECPIHFDVPEWAVETVNRRLVEEFGLSDSPDRASHAYGHGWPG